MLLNNDSRRDQYDSDLMQWDLQSSVIDTLSHTSLSKR